MIQGIKLVLYFKSIDSLTEFCSKLNEENHPIVKSNPKVKRIGLLKKTAVPKKEKNIRGHKERSSGLTPKVSEELERMCKEGATIAEMEKVFGVTHATISNWKTRLGLVGKKPLKNKKVKIIEKPIEESFPPLDLDKKCHFEGCKCIIIGEGFKDTDGRRFCTPKCYRGYVNSDQFRDDNDFGKGDKYTQSHLQQRDKYQIHLDTLQIICTRCGKIGKLSDKYMNDKVKKEIDDFKIKHSDCKFDVKSQ